MQAGRSLVAFFSADLKGVKYSCCLRYIARRNGFRQKVGELLPAEGSSSLG